MEKHLATHPQSKGADTDKYMDNWHPDGHYHVLGFQAGVSGRQLRGYITGTPTKGSNPDYIAFDTADKIVCATVGPMAWYTDERLIPYYGPLAVLYGELKEGRELPEGFDLNSLSTPYKSVWRKARENFDEEVAA